MTSLLRSVDVIVCFLWVAVELLVFIAMKKYKAPTISPLSQLVVAPFEFAVTIWFFMQRLSLGYAFLAYLLWTIIEILIIVFFYKLHAIPQKWEKWYIVILLISTCVYLYSLHFQYGMLLFSTLSTLIAIIFWYIYIFRPSYPITLFTLLIFIIKLLADILGLVVYFSSSPIIIRCISTSMAALDLCFIPTWFVLYRRNKNRGITFTTVSLFKKDRRSSKRKGSLKQNWKSTKKKYKKGKH